MSKIILVLDKEYACELLDESGNFCHMVHPKVRCDGDIEKRPDFCPLREVSDE